MIRHTLVTALLACLLAVTPAYAKAKDTPEARQAAAIELMELTGAAELGIQAMRNLANSLRGKAPPGFVEKLIEKATKESLTELVLPIYVKHLDLETMKATIKFYKTPAGKRMIEKQGVIQQESMIAGQAWGLRLVKEIQAEVEAAGPPSSTKEIPTPGDPETKAPPQ